jgi:hypothetical protein
MRLVPALTLLALASSSYGQGFNLSALLGGAATPGNSTAPAVPSVAGPTGAVAPTSSASQVPSASVASAPPAAPIGSATATTVASTNQAPCPYANQGTSSTTAPAPSTTPPVVGPKAREMDNQLTNLRTAIELFQDFQRQYQLADDNPIMQQIYQLFAPILQAANNIR